MCCDCHEHAKCCEDVFVKCFDWLLYLVNCCLSTARRVISLFRDISIPDFHRIRSELCLLSTDFSGVVYHVSKVALLWSCAVVIKNTKPGLR